MSGFEENPFGEPTVNDPFSDPAVRRAAASTPATRGIEDYNPFADPPVHGTVGGNPQQVRGASNPPIYGGIGASQQPATLQPTSQEPPPPTYARSPQQTIPTTLPTSLSPTEEQRAQAEWRAKRQEELRSPSFYPERNNWPPLPESCCVQPCFYQDIDVEIHTDFQKVVRQLYYLWLFHAFTLLLNVFGGFLLSLFDQGINTMMLSILYTILLVPFSFVCWFRPGYKAFKTDSSINFMVFFFIFCVQLAITSFMAIGFPDSGSCGIFKALKAFSSSAFLGFILLLIAACHCALTGGMLLMLTKIHRIYRTSPASVAKAQQEFATNFFRNEHVQSAAGNVAASAVRAQMASATQPRY